MSGLLKLRPADPDDEPVLREIRLQFDAERLGLQHWSPEQAQLAQQIADLQYRAHSSHYRTVKRNWDTKDCVIELDGQVVGRFIVTQDAKEVYLADIVVRSEHRGKGLGQAVIDSVKGECITSKRVLRLHVDPDNTALQFYLRLGFRAIETIPARVLMEWVPPTAAGPKLYV